jgi:Domain of unknown function (DUF4422)
MFFQTTPQRLTGSPLLFVATHKKAPLPPKCDWLVALGLAGYRPWTSLPMVTDASGVSIAHKNRNYSELTGWYWIWKNLPNTDIVGLCHYRRYFFLNEKADQISTPKFYLDPHRSNLAMVSSQEAKYLVRAALSDADVIVPRRQNLLMPISEQYRTFHLADDWNLFIQGIHETCPELGSKVQWFDTCCEANLYNMMITRRSFLDAYMTKLFSILEWMEGVRPFATSPYQCRVPAFIAERFFSFYLHATGARFVEVPIAFTERWTF